MYRVCIVYLSCLYRSIQREGSGENERKGEEKEEKGEKEEKEEKKKKKKKGEWTMRSVIFILVCLVYRSKSLTFAREKTFIIFRMKQTHKNTDNDIENTDNDIENTDNNIENTDNNIENTENDIENTAISIETDCEMTDNEKLKRNRKGTE